MKAQMELWLAASALGPFLTGSDLQPNQIADQALVLPHLVDALNGRLILMSIRGVNFDSHRGCTAVRVMP
jgi:hypothetical protein